MLRVTALLFALLVSLTTTWAVSVDALIQEGLAAEKRLDSTKALDLFLQADKANPDDVFILQKIARQYSDSIVDLPDTDIAKKKRLACEALAYAERAVALDPKNAVSVLSLAVCHGTLAVYSDTGTKIRYSRLMKEEAERALTLDPNYAWAHHFLGRWNYEVASLGGPTKFFVRIIYGGLPDASYKQAITHLQRAVELEPNTLSHHIDLGFAYLADGQKDKARACYDQGLAMLSIEKHDEIDKARARAALKTL
jgi:tetratricopeptide (TPR) repeat protein